MKFGEEYLQNLLGKGKMINLFKENFNLFTYVFFYALFNVSGVSLLKKNVSGSIFNNIQSYLYFLCSPQILLAFALIFISLFFALRALTMTSIVIFNPLAIGINFIITISFGIFLFNDHISITNTIGIFFILFGIILVSLK